MAMLEPLTSNPVADRIRKALEPFVDDSDFVRCRYAVIDENETHDDAELVELCESFEQAVAAWKRLTAEDPQASLAITGESHGVIAAHYQMTTLFAEPIGTFECPICGLDKPHAHTQAEIDRHRESEASVQKMHEEDRAEVLGMVASIEKNYGQRPRLAEAVAAVEAALRVTDETTGVQP